MQQQQRPALAVLIRALTLCVLVGVAPLAQAAFTTLTLPSLNSDIRTYSDGATYAPLLPSTQTWNGTPFRLSIDANGNNVFVTGVLDIAVGVFGVTQAYTIINSGFGTLGSNNGVVEFFGSNSAYFKVDLIQGVNIRDHYDNGFNNTIDGINALPAFNVGPGRARLDEQIYNLPLSFRSQTLNTIRYTGLNLGVAGVPFIAAATVSVAAVPEPASSVLMLFGLACCSVACRRRSAR